MYDEHRQLTYNQVIERDEKRFRAADRDRDGKLSREEYADFLHPGKRGGAHGGGAGRYK